MKLHFIEYMRLDNLNIVVVYLRDLKSVEGRRLNLLR